MQVSRLETQCLAGFESDKVEQERDSNAVADIHSIALRDDGIAFYTAPGESIDSTVGCWVVVGATGADN